MKKFLGSLLLGSTLLVTASTAEDIIIPVDYQTQLDKMDKLFNTMMHKHLGNASLYNFSYPRTNIVNDAKHLIYQFDLAGTPKENIKLTIDENNFLTLEGEKKSATKDKNKTYAKQEIFYGKFKKVMQLPENIDKEKLTTKYDNGILTVTIPKTEVKKPKAKLIPIR